MIRTGFAALALATLTLPLGAMADTPPPADALPLSRILATVESNVTDLAYIDEVEWDDDGYWEVEYKTTDGKEVKVKVDPVSGQTR